MRVVSTSNAPQPVGHYSQAVVHNDTVYTAGILGIDPKDPERVPDGLETQARFCLENLQGVVEAAGSGKDKIVKVTVFVSDIGHWPEVDRLFAELFGEHKPARSVVPTGRILKGFLVGMEAIAVL